VRISAKSSLSIRGDLTRRGRFIRDGSAKRYFLKKKKKNLVAGNDHLCFLSRADKTNVVCRMDSLAVQRLPIIFRQRDEETEDYASAESLEKMEIVVFGK